jgi:hypothetical protein
MRRRRPTRTRGARALAWAAAFATALGIAIAACATTEETTPLGYVVAPSIAPDSGHGDERDARDKPGHGDGDGGYSRPRPASDARK